MSTKRSRKSPGKRKQEIVVRPGDGTADHRWFRAVADYTYDWESWHADDGRLIWVNPAVQRITGYSVAECMAMNDYPLPMVVEEDRAAVAKVLESAKQRTSGEGTEFRSLYREGGLRWMSLSWQPMFDDQGTYLGFRTSVRDVTERQRLREQLRLHAEHLEQLVQERTARLRQLEQRQRQMEKLAALGQLAAGVAHEINNPLAGMRNAFELIKSDLGPEHEHYELLGLVDGEIERISGIIHQMYQLYRRSPQPATRFAIDRVVHEVIYLLDHVARKNQITLKCTATDNPVMVLLPEGEVKQILYNLLRNATQASSAGDKVTASITCSSNEVAVHVQDNGPGILPDVMPRIFDPFFSTKQGDSESGMGLGLSVSRSLIEAMGGRIDVSTQQGTGTVFSAVFPHRLDTPQERPH